jgi:hypothetical protein
MRGDDYLCLVAEIQPNVVILPDVLNDAIETRSRGLTFIDDAGTLERMYRYDYMAVIQGRSEEEWMEEFKFWCFHATDNLGKSVHSALHPRIKYLGVPYDIDFEVSGALDGDFKEWEYTNAMRRALRRVKLLEKIKASFGTALFMPRIHLLGINELYEFHLIHKRGLAPMIYSNDTTAPYAAAYSGKSFMVSNEGAVCSGEKDWDRLNFGALAITPVQRATLERNLILYKEAVNPVRSFRG